MIDSDGIDLLAFGGELYECISEEIVGVFGDESLYVLDDVEDIEGALLDGLRGEIDIHEGEIEFVVCQEPHLLIGLHVVHVEDINVVE